MKCIKCNVEMDKTKTDVNFKNGKITIREVDAFQCPVCKEIRMNIEQAKEVQEIAQKLGVWKVAPRKKIRREISFDGKDYIIKIPKSMMDSWISESKEVDLWMEKKNLIEMEII